MWVAYYCINFGLIYHFRVVVVFISLFSGRVGQISADIGAIDSAPMQSSRPELFVVSISRLGESLGKTAGAMRWGTKGRSSDPQRSKRKVCLIVSCTARQRLIASNFTDKCINYAYLQYTLSKAYQCLPSERYVGSRVKAFHHLNLFSLLNCFFYCFRKGYPHGEGQMVELSVQCNVIWEQSFLDTNQSKALMSSSVNITVENLVT